MLEKNNNNRIKLIRGQSKLFVLFLYYIHNFRSFEILVAYFDTNLDF